jgi:starch synthase
MDALLSSRAVHLHSIVNGIDTELWNPSSDPALPAHFSIADLSGKRLVKAALLNELGLPPTRINRPLIGVVARLVHQKGLDLLMENPRQFLDLDLSLALIGDGDPQQEDFFRWLAAAHPTRVAVKIGFDRALSRRIIAGSDVFLLPSRYEPCGLTQLYAMRYGALPLVHSTGGLKDTVSRDNGFLFQIHSWRALLDCLREMDAAWGTTKWGIMQRAGMSADHSWNAPAAAYSELYEAMNHN